MANSSNNAQNFHAAAAAYILGKTSNVKLQGSKEKLLATKQVLEASRALYTELNSENASLSQVTKLLEEKRIASSKFTQITGINWLL